MKTPVVHSLVMLSISGAIGCGLDTAGETAAASNPVPVIGIALDRGFQRNNGLVTMLDHNGWPLRDGSTMDPVIVEARRFYDTLQAPGAEPVMVDYPDPFTGEPPGMRTTAPLTLDDWKRTFNITPRDAGESLEAYRLRSGVIVYYNKDELGLGRELGCAEFDDDGEGPDGKPLRGVACYVTNYGTAFRDFTNSLPMAIEGMHPKNTVCISYRPSMPASYQVQFYTYNSDGQRREWAQLDTLGPRPVPQVCINCHGGSYDSEHHLARSARFLPLDPNVVLFAAPGTPGGVTRADQEERIRKLNSLSARSPLTGAQSVMLDQLYDGKLNVPGAVTVNEWAPPAWDDTPAHRQLFDKVIKPNCSTCHAAMESSSTGDTLAVYNLFKSPTLLNSGLAAHLCNQFTMPNAQATRLSFWEPSPISFVDHKQYDSPADLLLSQLGMEREQCTNLEDFASCNRGPNPDELCGNAYSGRACDRETGQCVPNLHDSHQPGEPNGICKTDKTLGRGCPYPEQCRATGLPPKSGLDGYDGVCSP